jgi:hypothetical protein
MNPVILAGLGAAATWVLRERFDNRLERDVRALGSKKPRATDPEGLPEAVRRLVLRARAAWPATPHVVRVTQHGRLRRRSEDAWIPFEAVAHVAVGHPARTWHVRQSRLWGVREHDVESLCFGEARSESSFLGAIPLDSTSGAELVRSQLIAYMADLPWAPHAMLDDPDVGWTHAPGGELQLSMARADDSVRLTVELDAQGEISRMRGTRPRWNSGGWRDVPWSREYGDYGTVAGLRVPRHAETRWETDPPFVHLRTHVTDLTAVSEPG